MDQRDYSYSPEQLEETEFINRNLLSGGTPPLLGHKDLVIRINTHRYQAYFFQQLLNESRQIRLQLFFIVIGQIQILWRRNFTSLPDPNGFCGARSHTDRYYNYPYLCPLCEGIVNLHTELGERQGQDRSTQRTEDSLSRI